MFHRLSTVEPRFAAKMLGPVKQLPDGVAFSFSMSEADIDAVGLRETHLLPDREIVARLTQEIDPAPASTWLGKAWNWLSPKTLTTTFTMSHLRGWVKDVHSTTQLLKPSQTPDTYKVYGPLTIMRPALKKFLQLLPKELDAYQPAIHHATGGEWSRLKVFRNPWGRVIAYQQFTGIVPPRPGEYSRKVSASNPEAKAFVEQRTPERSRPYEFILPKGSSGSPAE